MRLKSVLVITYPKKLGCKIVYDNDTNVPKEEALP
jgi:hypothetical protein